MHSSFRRMCEALLLKGFRTGEVKVSPGLFLCTQVNHMRWGAVWFMGNGGNCANQEVFLRLPGLVGCWVAWLARTWIRQTGPSMDRLGRMEEVFANEDLVWNFQSVSCRTFGLFQNYYGKNIIVTYCDSSRRRNICVLQKRAGTANPNSQTNLCNRKFPTQFHPARHTADSFYLPLPPSFLTRSRILFSFSFCNSALTFLAKWS